MLTKKATISILKDLTLKLLHYSLVPSLGNQKAKLEMQSLNATKIILRILDSKTKFVISNGHFGQRGGNPTNQKLEVEAHCPILLDNFIL